MTIPDREDKLQQLKDVHFENATRLAAALIESGNLAEPDRELLVFHKSGVDLFNEFDRTLDEYGLSQYEINTDIATRKSEDALNFADTIVDHWNTVNLICEKYDLDKPVPSTTSYATLQRVIKHFFPDLASDYKSKFEAAGLPVYGFVAKDEHSGWSIRESIRKIPTIVGLAFFFIGAILAFAFPEMNGNQYLIFRLFISIGAMFLIYEFSDGILKLKMTLPGRLALSATGGVALFILIYFFNPPIAP